MKLKSPLKNNDVFKNLSEIFSHFPDNYEELEYYAPNFFSVNVLLNKKESVEEIINLENEKDYEFWNHIKDYSKFFKRKFSNSTYTKKFFEELLEEKEKEKNELKKSINKYMLSAMSVGNNQKHYKALDRIKSKNFWQLQIDNLNEIENRIKNVYFLNKNSLDLTKILDNNNSFCFSMLFDNQIDKNLDFLEFINLSRGKVLLISSNDRVYKRILEDWNCNKIKNKKINIWTNY